MCFSETRKRGARYGGRGAFVSWLGWIVNMTQFSLQSPLRAPRLGVSILSYHFTDSEPGLSCKERMGAARAASPYRN